MMATSSTRVSTLAELPLRAELTLRCVAATPAPRKCLACTTTWPHARTCTDKFIQTWCAPLEIVFRHCARATC